MALYSCSVICITVEKKYSQHELNFKKLCVDKNVYHVKTLKFRIFKYTNDSLNQ